MPAIPTTAVPKPIITASHISIEDFESTVTAHNPEECEYRWAYDEDLAELAGNFEESIQALQPQAQTDISAFGEKCVRSNGNTDFVIMETDFEVMLTVDDVYNEYALGEWIAKVMQVIEQVSSSHVVGSQPGSVTIVFRSGKDEHRVNFPIEAYRNLRSGLSKVQILQILTGP